MAAGEKGFRNEVLTTRLYYKSPGAKILRRGSAAELLVLTNAGWQETHRRDTPVYADVRLERRVAVINFETGGPPAGPRPAPRPKPDRRPAKS